MKMKAPNVQIAILMVVIDLGVVCTCGVAQVVVPISASRVVMEYRCAESPFGKIPCRDVATLSFDGSQIIVCRSGIDLVQFDVETLQARTIIESAEILTAWTDSHTRGLFAFLGPNEFANTQYPMNVPGKLMYFEKESDWLAWKPAWQLQCRLEPYFGTQYLPRCGHHAIFGATHELEKTWLQVIGPSGNVTGKFSAPGCVAGIEETGAGLEIYAASKTGAAHEYAVTRSVFDLEERSLGRPIVLRTLNYSAAIRATRQNITMANPFLCFAKRSHGSRILRNRGVNAGDVSSFVKNFENEFGILWGSPAKLTPFNHGACSFFVQNILAAHGQNRQFWSFTLNGVANLQSRTQSLQLEGAHHIYDFVLNKERQVALTVQELRTADGSWDGFEVRVWDLSDHIKLGR